MSGDRRLIALLVISLTLAVIMGTLYVYESTRLEQPKYCVLTLEIEDEMLVFSDMTYVKGDDTMKPSLKNERLGVNLWFDDILPGVEDGHVFTEVEFISEARGVVCEGGPEFFYMGIVSNYQ